MTFCVGESSSENVRMAEPHPILLNVIWLLGTRALSLAFFRRSIPWMETTSPPQFALLGYMAFTSCQSIRLLVKFIPRNSPFLFFIFLKFFSGRNPASRGADDGGNLPSLWLEDSRTYTSPGWMYRTWWVSQGWLEDWSMVGRLVHWLHLLETSGEERDILKIHYIT